MMCLVPSFVVGVYTMAGNKNIIYYFKGFEIMNGNNELIGKYVVIYEE